MTIQQKQEEGATVLVINGRVDTTTSPQLQAAILRAFQTAQNVTLDFTDVNYISSAGLRALLIGKKTADSKKGRMLLRNVGTMVMSVLEMVGFSAVMDIE